MALEQGPEGGLVPFRDVAPEELLIGPLARRLRGHKLAEVPQHPAVVRRGHLRSARAGATGPSRIVVAPAVRSAQLFGSGVETEPPEFCLSARRPARMR